VNRLGKRIEQAFRLVVQAEPILQRIKGASRAGRLPKGRLERLVDAALAADVISVAEAELVREAELARDDAIQVDSFTLAEYMGEKEELLKVPKALVVR